MRYLKYLFTAAFVFVLLSVDVSAEEFEHLDFHEYLGITYEDLLEFEVEPEHYVFPLPAYYSDANPDLVKDEYIRMTDMTLVSNYSGWPNTNSRTALIGEGYAVGNGCHTCIITISNSGDPLFNVGGILSFKLLGYSTSLSYTLKFSDGSTSHGYIYNNYSPTEYVWFEQDFDNLDADIVEVSFTWAGPIPQSNGGAVISCGVYDYGYLADYTEPEPEEPEIPMIGGDLNGTVDYLINFIVSIVDCFFVLQIIEGVSFGYFILACMIFGLVFNFFFRKLIG